MNFCLSHSALAISFDLNLSDTSCTAAWSKFTVLHLRFINCTVRANSKYYSPLVRYTKQTDVCQHVYHIHWHRHIFYPLSQQ